jgi:hypothetical protein
MSGSVCRCNRYFVSRSACTEQRASRGTHVGGWTAKEIHQAILTTFDLSSRTYGLNQLRYDLRKLKGHALLPYRCLQLRTRYAPSASLRQRPV